MKGIPFRLLIHFESIFAYGVWQGSNFILLHVDTQLSQHHLLKRLLFPHWMVLADGSTTQSDLKMQGSTYKNCNGFLSFSEREMSIFAFTWNCKGTWWIKTILKKRNKMGGHTLADSKTYYKATAIKAVWFWHMGTHIDQRNKTESPHGAGRSIRSFIYMLAPPTPNALRRARHGRGRHSSFPPK